MRFRKASLALIGVFTIIDAASINKLRAIETRQFGGSGGQGGGQGQGGQGGQAAVAAKAAQGGNGGNNGQAAAAANNNNNAAAATGGNAALALNAKNVQAASNKDGNETPADGQAASNTDAANFINFCTGQTLTNGLQVKGGSCNGIVMGKIPSTANMISAIITNPKPAQNIAADTTFKVEVQTKGLTAGSFTNAAATYYSAPQDLAANGQVIGHTHITIQDLGNSLQPAAAPDPVQFVFFKGVNDAGNGKGLLSAEVTGGLPAGNYRVCSMTSSSNHQPVLMPVAQRGAQDDCQKFTVGAANAGGNANANAGNTNANANKAGASANGGKKQKERRQAAVGGIAAPAVAQSGNADRPFSVNGSTFANESAANERACAVQNNACSNAANSGTAGVTIAACAAQNEACSAAA